MTFDSKRYWISRYQKGGTSGKGSYGRMAEYKAGVINDLVREADIKSVVEFGCGDGDQMSYLEIARYTGVDISEDIVENARTRFNDRPDWNFILSEDVNEKLEPHDMSLSLDVIFHLIEDDVFDQYMRDLFRFAKTHVLIYSTDNEGSGKVPHFRSRHYSAWIRDNAAGWHLTRTYNNPYNKSVKDGLHTTGAFFQLFEKR